MAGITPGRRGTAARGRFYCNQYCPRSRDRYYFRFGDNAFASLYYPPERIGGALP
jgi:hypothetical protein